MKIYTKTGDQGQTSLFAGGRVGKDHVRVQAYGTLDEANSFLGLSASLLQPLGKDKATNKIENIQNQLFSIGSELATPDLSKLKIRLVDDSQIMGLEKEIDEMQKDLPPLKNFILPGGTQAASAIHLARTMVRRAEREVVSLMQTESVRPQALQYLNRLSDYLFVLGRAVNQWENGQEKIWKFE